jgi:predicted nucleotidyltransferase
VSLNRDFNDLLSELNAEGARYLLVGGYALSFYGRPRATGDLDLWVDSTVVNAERVFRSLARYGAPLEGITPEDFSKPGTVLQIGVAPNRVDILTSLTGLTFEKAWENRKAISLGGIPLFVISELDFIRNKRSVARAQDIVDAEEIEAVLEDRGDSE